MTIIDRLVVVLGFRHDPTGLAQFRKSAAKAQATLGRVSRVAAKGGLALTGVAVAAATSFAKFETEMSKIEGLVGISREQLDAWRGDLSAIARETGQAPIELAKALFYVTSAGLRGSYAIDVLRSSAKASAAGLGDQATVADLLTSAMNAYGVESLSAVDATNALTEAVRLGKLEPASLAGAMGRVLPVASAMGVQFSEVAGLMAAMSKTGTDATAATTQLNAVMLQLLKPSDGAKKAYERVGTSAEELRKVVAEKGLFEALIKIRNAFGENNQALVEVFPNIRALRGIFDLLGPQLESNRALLDEMADSTGILDEAFGAAEKTLRFKWRRMMAVVQDGMIRLGEVLAPSFERLIGWIESVAEWFNNLGDASKKAISILLLVGPVMLAIAVAAKVLALAITIAKGAMVALRVAAILLNAVLLLTKVLFVNMNVIVWLFNAALYAVAIAVAVVRFALLLLNGVMLLTKALFVGMNVVVWVLNAALYAVAIAVAVVKFGLLALGIVVKLLTVLFGILWTVATGGIFLLVVALAAAGYAIYRYRDAIVGALTSAWEWLKGLIPQWRDIGKKLIMALISGITFGGGSALVSAVKGIFGKVRDLLPFSDAKVGPLADLTESGRRFSETFARGVAAGANSVPPSVLRFSETFARGVGPLADLTESGRRFSETFARGVAAGANSVPPSVLRALPHPQTILAPLRAPPQTFGVTGGSRTLTISVGDINVRADGGDPRRIAAEIGDAIRDEFRSVAEEFDSQERA